MSRENRKILLEEDIYCAGFLTFLQSKNQANLNQMVLKCVGCFILQSVSVYYFIMYYLGEVIPSLNNSDDNLFTLVA